MRNLLLLLVVSLGMGLTRREGIECVLAGTVVSVLPALPNAFCTSATIAVITEARARVSERQRKRGKKKKKEETRVPSKLVMDASTTSILYNLL